MKPEPMLAQDLDRDLLLADVVEGSAWYAEQKIDGERVLVHVVDGKARFYSRTGKMSRATGVMAVTLPFRRLTHGEWWFDGEYLNGALYLFDLPAANTGGFEYTSASTEATAEMRRRTLEVVHEHVFANTAVKLLPIATTPDDKLSLIDWVIENDCEGVIFKAHGAMYLPGQRTTAWRKYKLVNTCDCIVTETMVEGKRSALVSLVAVDPESGVHGLVEVGAVKIVPESMCEQLKYGDIIEVRYLYATDDNRLFQPRMKGIRTDKTALDCTLDQLVYTNKTSVWLPPSSLTAGGT